MSETYELHRAAGEPMTRAASDPQAAIQLELAMLTEVWVEHAPVAFHEAAHAVLARLCSRAIYAVTIDPTNHHLGTMVACRGARDESSMRESARIAAAGVIAESRFTGVESCGGDDDDADLQSVAWSLVGRLASHEAQRAEVDRAKREAAALVNQNWNHIERVALSLLRHHAVVHAISPIYEAIEERELDRARGEM